MKLPFENITNDYTKKLDNLISILTIIKKNPLSISELSRELKMNRSTTRYYLSLLKQEQLIKYERQQNVPGRPTKIMINSDDIEKQINEMKLEYEKQKQKYLNSPEVLEFLKKLSERDINKENLTAYEFVNLFGAFRFLEQEEYIQEFFRLTEKGREFLKSL